MGREEAEMKLLILAFDGLEATLVEKWKLRHLLGEEHGTYPVDASRYLTPVLWASFLTGLGPEHFREKVKFVEGHSLPGRVRSLLPGPLKPVLRKFLRPVLGPRPPSIRGRYRTIFDLAGAPLPYNVFCYNELPEQFNLRLRTSITRIMGDEEACFRAYRAWMKWTVILAERFRAQLVRRPWNLAMCHFYFTDITGHLWPRGLRRAYLLADTITAYLRPLADVTLVVSDHGMNRQTRLHTPYGFWSITGTRLAQEPRSVTDFYRLIRQLLMIMTT